MNKKLYVGNLSYLTTETTLREVFGAVGEVISVTVITDRMTDRSRGFGFVEMVDENTARQAIDQLNGKFVHGRELRVDEARPRRARSAAWQSGSRW